MAYLDAVNGLAALVPVVEHSQVSQVSESRRGAVPGDGHGGVHEEVGRRAGMVFNAVVIEV